MQFGEILGSALLVLLCLTGLTALLQALNRWLLSPGKEHEMVMLVPVRGAQPDAEQLLRGELSVTEVAEMSSGCARWAAPTAKRCCAWTAGWIPPRATCAPGCAPRTTDCFW